MQHAFAAGVDSANNSRCLVDLRDRYLSALLRGDRKEALRLVIDEGFAKGVDVLELQLGVIQEAQREIGRLWQENRISIAEEHMATAVAHMALAHLYDQAQRAAANDKRVMVACVEGELHDFPARLVADALDLAGFDVRYLGANVPTQHLLRLLAREPVDLLALSATMAFNVPALRSAVQRVRVQTGGSLPIAIGGGACVWVKGICDQLKADATGRDAQEMVAAARRLLGVRA